MHLERGTFIRRGGVELNVRDDGSVHIRAQQDGGFVVLALSEDDALLLLRMLGSVTAGDDF